ncbi:unnamed protein product [Vitrella brassicaformis CCMP3155]|uniref:Saposin B-type domain-containing protein n=2 Tax=Vitrella brassicaformis TaxID=1169539 RepID=A0A0G4EC67_VITBC|nr:unnamed protein product [Vitrella brassicaformis CCMP3155]|mmetsp:Transcript_6340/g.15285  ORF Transcript_6340/g.15285 Transcript_6340/m.15285 type:complete len:365 (+) Transcript_6340:49-1143(+)|eukprot:CEL92934.1 unnamed protein product [Vitrella brassicaformis CCMP3155]
MQIWALLLSFVAFAQPQHGEAIFEFVPKHSYYQVCHDIMDRAAAKTNPGERIGEGTLKPICLNELKAAAERLQLSTAGMASELLDTCEELDGRVMEALQLGLMGNNNGTKFCGLLVEEESQKSGTPLLEYLSDRDVHAACQQSLFDASYPREEGKTQAEQLRDGLRYSCRPVMQDVLKTYGIGELSAEPICAEFSYNVDVALTGNEEIKDFKLFCEEGALTNSNETSKRRLPGVLSMTPPPPPTQAPSAERQPSPENNATNAADSGGHTTAVPPRVSEGHRPLDQWGTHRPTTAPPVPAPAASMKPPPEWLTNQEADFGNLHRWGKEVRRMHYMWWNADKLQTRDFLLPPFFGFRTNFFSYLQP